MTRDEIEALLPFHVNGTLEGDEARAVAEALAADPDLRAEAEALAAIRGTMKADDTGFTPGEMGLARLLREAKATSQATPTSAPRLRPVIWQVAAALLLAVALGQGALLWTRDASPGFELAGAVEADFTVAFRPDATEAGIRALLTAAGAEIVSGPSALGLYGVAALEGFGQDDAYETLSASELVESAVRAD